MFSFKRLKNGILLIGVAFIVHPRIFHNLESYRTYESINDVLWCGRFQGGFLWFLRIFFNSDRRTILNLLLKCREFFTDKIKIGL